MKTWRNDFNRLWDAGRIEMWLFVAPEDTGLAGPVEQVRLDTKRLYDAHGNSISFADFVKRNSGKPWFLCLPDNEVPPGEGWELVDVGIEA